MGIVLDNDYLCKTNKDSSHVIRKYFIPASIGLIILFLPVPAGCNTPGGPGSVATTASREVHPGRGVRDVNPLITVTWDQGCFYNEKCPVDTSSAAPCYHAIAGSGAVAMAQIMKYYNFPLQGTGSNSYTLPGYGNLYVDFSAANYNWANMPPALTGSNDAVSTLIYHCGVAQNMNYGPTSSSSASSLIDSAFVKYFGYSPGCLWKWKADYPPDQWLNMIKTELDAGRPLVYYGNDGGTGEQFFICDGYQGTDLFHFNWGWGGTENGYFTLGDLTPGSHNFNFAQGALFNLFPQQSGTSLKMDFESVTDFSLSFNPWTVRDIDGDNTYGIQGYTFPNSGSPMAFIAFNPASVNPSMASDTAIQPHSGSRFGACFADAIGPNNDWFISPQIQLGTDGQFSFWERSYTGQYGLEKFKVLVSTTDNNPSSFTVISGSSPLPAPLKWTKKVFSLSAYNGQMVYIAIQCVSDTAFIFMIDDIEVKTSSTSALNADFSADPASIKAGGKINFTDQSSGNPTTWAWYFPGGFPSFVTQQNPSDIRYDYPGSYDVTLRISDGTDTSTVTKTGFINVSGFPSYMSLDFESLADFTMSFSPWSVLDVNGGATYSIDSVYFPNNGLPMAFICFNPSQAVPPPRNMTAHSGNKFGACFSSQPPHNPNNKWLISPRMSLGSDASIRFWTETYNTYWGLEQFYVGVSTTGKNASDFVRLTTSPQDAPADWTKISYSLAAYAGQDVYIGINCVSDDLFLFMIDDIEIGNALGANEEIIPGEISIYPNPAADHFSINTGRDDRVLTGLSMVNNSGKTVRELSFTRGSGNIYETSVTGLEAGIYYLVIRNRESNFVKKIVIIR